MFRITVECSKCGETFPCDEVLTVCTGCGGALLFRYDLARVAEKISKNVLEKRESTFWCARANSIIKFYWDSYLTSS